MANAVNITTLMRSRRKVVLYVTIKSDGTQETNTVIYDSSAQAAQIKDGNGVVMADPLTCTINVVKYSSNSVAGTIQLLFDASTKVLAIGLPSNNAGKLDFSCEGGLKNYAGTGKNGDVLLTTTALAAGESVSFVAEIFPY